MSALRKIISNKGTSLYKETWQCHPGVGNFILGALHRSGKLLGSTIQEWETHTWCPTQEWETHTWRSIYSGVGNPYLAPYSGVGNSYLAFYPGVGNSYLAPYTGVGNYLAVLSRSGKLILGAPPRSGKLNLVGNYLAVYYTGVGNFILDTLPRSGKLLGSVTTQDFSWCLDFSYLICILISTQYESWPVKVYDRQVCEETYESPWDSAIVSPTSGYYTK